MYADHLHRRRQWRSAEGTLEGTFNQLTAYNGILTLPEVVRIRGLGLPQHLSAYIGRVVTGVRYALQMDQTGSVAFRRHAARVGDFLARPYR